MDCSVPRSDAKREKSKACPSQFQAFGDTLGLRWGWFLVFCPFNLLDVVKRKEVFGGELVEVGLEKAVLDEPSFPYVSCR